MAKQTKKTKVIAKTSRPVQAKTIKKKNTTKKVQTAPKAFKVTKTKKVSTNVRVLTAEGFRRKMLKSLK